MDFLCCLAGGQTHFRNVSRHSRVRFLHSIENVRNSTPGPGEYARARAIVRQALGKRREAEEARAERRRVARRQNELQDEVRRQLLAADLRATAPVTASLEKLKAAIRRMLETFRM